MKKFYSIISFLALALLLNVTNVHAESVQTALTVNQVKTEKNANVDVPIRISNNTGICGVTLMVSYDEKLELVNVSRGEALSTLEMTKPGNYQTNPVKILWDGMEADNTNGEIVVLTFRTPNEEGVYPITVKYENGDIIDGQLTPVELDVTNGMITVESNKDEPEKESDQKTEQTTGAEQKAGTEKNQNAEKETTWQNMPESQMQQTALKKVRGIKVTGKGKGRVNVSWNRVTGAKGYQVQYSRKKNFASAKTVKVSSGKKVKAIVKKLKSKKTYYFRVRATAGSNTGKWSAVRKVKKVK